MVSTVFNVARWSVFGAGIAYGFLHQAGIYTSAEAAAKQAAFNKKVELIKQAKAEWAKLHPKQETKAVEGAAANLDDPNFDPAQWIDSKVKALAN